MLIYLFYITPLSWCGKVARKINTSIAYVVLAICLALPYNVQRWTTCTEAVMKVRSDSRPNDKNDSFAV